MTLPIAARNPLIEISAALHAKQPAIAQELIEGTFVETQTKVYERMWQVMERPYGDKYGEMTFKDRDVPTQKKIKAVETVILEDVPPMPAPAKPFQPPNSIEVKTTAYWDTGFDPRFDEGGNFLLAPQGSSKTTFTQMIVAVAAYCLFVFKAYCSPWSEGRQLRKAILAGASFEKILSSYCVRALVNNIDDPCLNWIPLAEYDFLEKTGDIYQSLNPSPSHPLRLFPREVIFPIHCMNKPQDKSWVIEKMQPGLENMDLVKAGASFTRLNRTAYSSSSGNKQLSFDLFEFDYVPHYLFIHATRESAERLKLACRELRLQIAQTSTDFKCAFSFVACQTKLRPVFDKFHQAWQGYVQSHELLIENQAFWSFLDYRKHEYADLRAETKMPPKKMDEHRRNKDWPSARTYDKRQEHVKEAYMKWYSETKTGRILKALLENLPTLPNKV